MHSDLLFGAAEQEENMGGSPMPRSDFFIVCRGVGFDVGNLAGELKLDDLDELRGVNGLDKQGRQYRLVKMAHLLLDLIRRKSREQNDGKRFAMLADVVKNVEAVDIGHFEIEEEEIDLAVLELLESGFAVAGFIDLKTDATQVMRQGEPFDRGVIAQEQSRLNSFMRRCEQHGAIIHGKGNPDNSENGAKSRNSRNPVWLRAE
jgi:hypothetical protein